MPVQSFGNQSDEREDKFISLAVLVIDSQRLIEEGEELPEISEMIMNILNN